MTIATSVFFHLQLQEERIWPTAFENPASQERTGFFVGPKPGPFHRRIFCWSSLQGKRNCVGIFNI